MVNTQKYYIFFGSINEARLRHIANKLGFNIDGFPFLIWGFPSLRVSLRLGLLDLL